MLDRKLSELSEDTPGRTIQVGLSKPPDMEVLQQLNQIKSITPLADDRFRIEHDGSSDQFAEEFAQFAVDRHWGLFELLPEHDSLEAIFIRLTGSDQPSVTNQMETAA